MSIHSLITKLCSSLATEVGDFPTKEKLLKKMKTRAFEILLSNRSGVYPDDKDEADIEHLIFDIQGHVYWSAKDKGDWCLEMNETMQELVTKTEEALQVDPTVASVLRLLCHLAHTAPSTHQSKKPSYGLDLSTLISDGSLKYNPLMKGSPAFSSKMFDITPITELPQETNITPRVFDSAPGSGLRHRQFFFPPEISHESSRTGLKGMENIDLTNANWVFPDLEMNGSKRREVDKEDNHLDEGYITPDHDLKSVKDQERPYIAWENMYLTDYKSTYTWESCGRARKHKEPPFLTECPEATDHFWKMIHLNNFVSSAQQNPALVPVALKPVTLQEFERDYKYLLTGVESNIFKFNKEKKTFVFQEGVYLKEISGKTMQSYCEDFIQCANCFRYLSILLQKETSTKRGNVFKALCGDIQRYLQLYWGIVLHAPPLRSLLHMSEWLHGLRTHLQFLVSLCRRLPKGSALLTHLYNQVPLVSHSDLAFLLYSILQSCCTVYFVMLQRWIFEGVCDDKYKEFFILCDDVRPEVLDKVVWNKMYQLNKALLPGFLRGLEKELLECGKSMALLKMCTPEDPICLELRKGYPSIVCCLNKAHVDKLREECRLYEQRCRDHCKQVFGDLKMEATKDEAYYSAIRAESLKKIKEAQEYHKQMAADKKRRTFDELKKGVEDAEARKLEYRKSQIEEEERLIQEEEQVYQLNEIRKEEEKNKILQYYTAISKAADERKEKAEWKIKRAELYKKRNQFFQESTKLEKLEIDECDVENTVIGNSSTQTSSVIATTTNICAKKEDSSAIAGSGDFAVVGDSIVTESARSQLLELTGNKVTCDSISEVDELENPHRVDEEHREYMIALDVAEKARQSAARFKERNMFNDYNIVTGEEKTYESRFCGVKETTESVESSAKEMSSETSIPCVQIPSQESITTNFPTIDSKTDIAEEKTTQVISVSSSPSNVQDRAIVDDREEGSSLLNQEAHKLHASFSPVKSDLKIEEIDMTTVYENLRMSVMIPLLTQQELANEAVLRLLFEKHNLIKHLESIRNYFFLLDGEFGRNLTRQLFTEVQAADNPNYIMNVRLNSLLQSAMGVLVDEEYTERLSFCIKQVPDALVLTDAKMLDCLSLRYRTEWPLSAVIHEEMIVRFDQTFSFLLKIQRVSWALEQISYLLKDKRLCDNPQFRQIQLHRHIMTHFINSLNNYVTAVVLEETWIILKKDLAKSKTMSEITTNLKDYCKILSFRSFHSKRLKPFLESLVELFGHILFYYELLRRNDWELDSDTKHYVHPRFNELYHHWASFLELANYLVRYLDIANTRQVFSEFLDKLVTVLCANNFYRNLAFTQKEKQERRKKDD